MKFKHNQVRPFMKDHSDQCIVGFLLGFTISMDED